ncbi:hypothetical protein PS910_02277 [Pseudomonas fluorescens]|nr:hypothetical protein PS910_02277 [Pseudomonas fluorescens]
MRYFRLPVVAALPLVLGTSHAFAQTDLVGPGDDRGAIVQTPLIDDFRMTGGAIQSLSQGDARDTFDMSAGRIVGAFEDGDVATFSGGRIGRVNLKLDNNIFDMSQDTAVLTLIDANLVSGFGNDTILLRGGVIGGNISTSGGTDLIAVSGGELQGNVLASAGEDALLWSGGSIGGSIGMGNGNDVATLANLDAVRLNILVDGGAGVDALTFGNSQPADASLFTRWETIQLTNASVLTLDNGLLLGDEQTGTGVLGVDASSSLHSRVGSVRSLDGVQNAGLVNAGLIDLTGGNDAQGRLTVEGNYVGNNGILRLNSVLAGDGAASDRLVVSRGAISGRTRLEIRNLGGAGATTPMNGIQVVEATHGATSNATAFVQTQTLSAGAFDYRLFRGGVTAGSENSWFLRSTLVAPAVPAEPTPVPAPVVPPVVVVPTDPPPVVPPAVTPPLVPDEPDDPPPVAPVAQVPIVPEQPVPVEAAALLVPVAALAPGQAALPQAIAGAASVPLYRPEVAVYAAAPRGAAVIARQALGTFHQRQGDQGLLTSRGSLSAGWGQAYGGNLRQQWTGTVNPSLDGDFYGFKVGQDLYAKVGDTGYRQHVGLYVSHSRLEAEVKGFALAVEDTRVGDLRLDGDSVGAYWTLIGPERAYLDAVVQFTDLDGQARSDRGGKLSLDGHAWTGSLETGYPLALSPSWTLEPQAQLIVQKVSLDSASDGVSQISHDPQTELTGRVGLRLEGNFTTSGSTWQPYVQANVWHGDGGRDTLTFDDVDRIKTDYRYTAVSVETGIVAQVAENLGIHSGIEYTTNLDSRQQERSGVNLGVRWNF